MIVNSGAALAQYSLINLIRSSPGISWDETGRTSSDRFTTRSIEREIPGASPKRLRPHSGAARGSRAALAGRPCRPPCTQALAHQACIAGGCSLISLYGPFGGCGFFTLPLPRGGRREADSHRMRSFRSQPLTVAAVIVSARAVIDAVIDPRPGVLHSDR